MLVFVITNAVACNIHAAEHFGKVRENRIRLLNFAMTGPRGADGPVSIALETASEDTERN